jgi:hypothetical protein
MKKILSITVQLATALVVVLAFVDPGASNALTNSLLPLSSGDQANITNDYAMTPNGRYIVFASDKSDVVGGDTNGKNDIFVRDTLNNTTTRVSVSSTGTQANDYSNTPIITNNGRYVLFQSTATNLTDISGVSGYTGGVYLHDMKTGTTELISAAYYHYSNNETRSVTPDDLSEDGRFVYYDAAIVGGSSTEPWFNVYVKDRSANTTSVVSSNASSTDGDLTSQAAKTSCDGRFAVFHSAAANLVSGDTNGTYDIYLVDTANGHTIKSLTLGGDAMSTNPQISCDGNYVLYNSSATNLISGYTATAPGVYLYDVANDTTELVSKDNAGNQIDDAGMNNQSPSISADGRYVVFSAYVNNGVTGSSKSYQIFVRDRQTSSTKTISMNSSSDPGNHDSGSSSISFDGSTVIYISNSDNLGFSNPSNNNYLVKATNF